jgi:hypothetical protein
MTKARTLLFCVILLVPLYGLVWATDFGLLVDQRAGYGGIVNNSSQPDYRGILLPRFSTLLDDSGEFYISAGLAMIYENEDWAFVPELLRTEFHWLFNWGDFTIGRMQYSDPLGIVAAGLFDGARFTFDTMAGSFSAGALYTGFLYKKRANIAMTDDERESLGAGLDYNDFMDTYFAPRRALFALDWAHPSLAGGFLRTNFALLGQFDLTGGDMHTQYVMGRLTFPFGAFSFDLGGSLGLGLLQDSADLELCFAAEAAATWTLPTPFVSRLSLMGRYTSGVSEGGEFNAFRPVTISAQSPVLQPRTPGTSMVFLDYSARFNRNFAMSFLSYYFIRNDLYTYTGYPIIVTGNGAENKGHLLGNEFFLRLFWIPASDVHFNLGGGIFLPSMGNVAPGQANVWRIELGLVISLL